MTAWSGRWNFNAIIIGLPGDGKTTVVKGYIRRHLLETPGIVLAHDPLAQFTRVGCARYESVGAWRRAAAAAAKVNGEMPRGASIGVGADGEAEAITELALELGAKLNSADRVRVPILVPYDEGSMRDGSGSTWMGKLDQRFIVLRRHRGCGGIFNIQEAGMLTAAFFKMSTDVVLFQLPSDRAAELDVKLYLEKGTLARAGVTRLGPHKYLRVQPRVGVVEGAM